MNKDDLHTLERIASEQWAGEDCIISNVDGLCQCAPNGNHWLAHWFPDLVASGVLTIHDGTVLLFGVDFFQSFGTFCVAATLTITLSKFKRDYYNKNAVIQSENAVIEDEILNKD